MAMMANHWLRLQDNCQLPLAHLAVGTRVHAIAGIGNPQRFYQSLRDLQLQVVEHDFPDHHAYDAGDFQFHESLPIVMTAKDAVKCGAFAQADWYSLHVNARLSAEFWQAFDVRLAAIIDKTHHYE